MKNQHFWFENFLVASKVRFPLQSCGPPPHRAAATATFFSQIAQGCSHSNFFFSKCAGLQPQLKKALLLLPKRVWLLLAASGSFWLLLAATCSSWLLLAATGSSRLLLAAPGYPCCSRLPGCSGLLLASPGCFWLLLAASGGFWLLLAAPG